MCIYAIDPQAMFDDRTHSSPRSVSHSTTSTRFDQLLTAIKLLFDGKKVGKLVVDMTC